MRIANAVRGLGGDPVGPSRSHGSSDRVAFFMPATDHRPNRKSNSATIGGLTARHGRARPWIEMTGPEAAWMESTRAGASRH
jgi:hypothetical protein